MDVNKCVVIAGGCLKWQGKDRLQTIASKNHTLHQGRHFHNKMHARNAIFSCSLCSWCSLFLFTIELLLTWVSPQWRRQWKVWKSFQVSYRIYFFLSGFVGLGFCFFFKPTGGLQTPRSDFLLAALRKLFGGDIPDFDCELQNTWELFLHRRKWSDFQRTFMCWSLRQCEKL